MRQIIPFLFRIGKPRNIRSVALTDEELSLLDSHAKNMGMSRARIMALAIRAYLQLLAHYIANPKDKSNPLHTFFETYLRLSQNEVKNDGTN